MGKTLSEDLRVRVIAAIDGGLSRNVSDGLAPFYRDWFGSDCFA